MTYPYFFAFGNNEKRATLKGRGLVCTYNTFTK